MGDALNNLLLGMRHSLRTRVLFATLVVLVAGIWSLAFYAQEMLHRDMRQMLGQQQATTVAMVAGQIDREFAERLEALEKVAEIISGVMDQGPAAVQAMLEKRWDLHALFNGGSYVTQAGGTAIADWPLSEGRVGVNYADREYVAVPVREGRSIVGVPVIGKKANTPVIVIGAPVKSVGGEVLGVLTGVINLARPNFLDPITSRYGESGGFLLVVPQHRLIAAATDKSRILEVYPPAGALPLADRFIGGYEGTGVVVNPHGVEVLASAKNVPTIGWYVTISLPTAEAFAPIRAMQRRTLLAALLLTVFIGWWLAWVLKRQLSPLRQTAQAVARMAESDRPPHVLPLARPDEIGQLVKGFNRLVGVLAEREKALKESENNLSITLQSIGDAVIATDAQGRVTRMNPVAERLTGWPLGKALGTPLVDVFRIINAETRASVENPVNQVMTSGAVVGLANHTVLLASDGAEYQIADSAAPIRDAAGRIVGVVLVFSDVTASYGLQQALREGHETLASILEATPDGFWRIDLQGRIREVNPAYVRQSGYSRDELLAMEVADLEVSMDRGQIASHIDTILRTGSRQFETLHRRKDGTVWPVEVSLTPRAAHGGEIMVFLRDISERKAAENTLRESRENYRLLVEGQSDLIVKVDPENRFLFVSPSYCEVFGKAEGELLGKSFMPLVHADDQESTRLAMERLQSPPYQVYLEQRAMTGKGWRWFGWADRAEVDSAGRILSITGVGRDITERRLSEENLRRSEASFRNFFEKNTSVLLLTDPLSGAILDANEAACAFYGYPKDRLLEMSISALSTEMPEEMVDERQRVLRGGRREFNFLHRLASGELRDVEVHLTPIESGGRTVLFSIIHDITERKRAEEKLQLSASVFSHAREAILITDVDGTIIEVNDSFTRITGYTHGEVVGKTPHVLSSGRHEKAFYETMWHDLAMKGHWYGEIWNRRKNGELFAAMQTISAVTDARGRPRQYVSLFSDITALKEHERELEHIAHYDVLTTLPNRVLLADRLHQAMVQANRRTQLLAVAYLDLDGFKSVNDRYGHETGDKLLIALSGRMKQTLREGDTLARLGGDEFVAVLLDLGDVASSMPMLNRLLAAAAQPVQIGEQFFQVSGSLGVTFYPQADEVDADQLLRQADQAMYQAKLAGKNRYHFFDAEHDRNVRGHHESIEHIRAALEAREFVLYYQPKVNMRTGEVVGAEALIRWQHPGRGLLSPGVFLPVIENHPLAVDIGEWVVATALTQIECWREDGLSIPVSINVGARQLLQLSFVPRLREILSGFPSIRPGDLEIEVLETSALEDLDRVSAVIDECREMGVGFSLDDFGTGYSSLTYLKRLSVNQLKIDQSFVRDMLDDPDDLSILGGVLSLANAFRRQVIAEGVESVDHGTMLLQLGCELAQGYGIARPMPAGDLPVWVRSWRPDPAWSRLPPVSRDDLPVLFAIVEHRAWIRAVEAYLGGTRDSLPLVHHQCRFAAWLKDEAPVLHAGEPALQSLGALHEEAHALASGLCELKANGFPEQAFSRLGELQSLRDALIDALQKLVKEHPH